MFLWENQANAQLGKYGITVTNTVNPLPPYCNPGQVVTICVTVSNFNQCPGGAWPNWIDGFLTWPTGNWTTITYVSAPTGNWRNSIQQTDDPAWWRGWAYSQFPPINQCFNDLGHNVAGPWTFCFWLTAAAAGDPCWPSSCVYNLDVYIYGDGDTGGCGACNCPTRGTPDGPYNIITSNASSCVGLVVDLLEFKCEYYNGITDLIWKTAYESNIEYFLIEVSSDAQNWIKLEYIKASNSSIGVSYKTQILGDFEYYRLSEVDFNGKINYLKTIDCDNNSITVLEDLWDVYNAYGELVIKSTNESLISTLIASTGVYFMVNKRSNLVKTKFIQK